MDRLDWFAPFAAAYNAYLWNVENGYAKATLEEADWQIAIREARYSCNRPVVWTWAAMMARTRVEWQRSEEGGG